MPEQTQIEEPQGKVAFYGPWIGEFGWELMAWQAWCRLNARNFDKVYVCSFSDMAPLYEDFATFIPHGYKKRHLDWTDTSNVQIEIPADVTTKVAPFKKYKLPAQHFITFGERTRSVKPRYLIHARGINKGGKNYPLDRWEHLAGCIGDNVASVGTLLDHHIKDTEDLRGLPLNTLMDEMANANVVIGQSSGVMHLAALCGARLVVWGDPRTYFGESLDQRYHKTWNPFKVPVRFIPHPEWDPDPDLILEAIITPWNRPKIQMAQPPDIEQQVAKAVQEGGKVQVPRELRDILKRAVESNRAMVTVHWMEGETLKHYWTTNHFPVNEMIPSMEHIKGDMKKGGVKENKIIHAPVERNYTPPEPPPIEGGPPEEEALEPGKWI